MKREHGIRYKGMYILENSGMLLNTYGKYDRGGVKNLSRTIKSEKMDSGTVVRYETRYDMSKQRELHKWVRVVYRACRRIYGKEKTQDECLDVFKIVFPAMNRAKASEEETAGFEGNELRMLTKVLFRWKPTGELERLIRFVIAKAAHPMPREEFVAFCEDILPVVMRIRKLTPRECFRLMDVEEKDIDKIQASGISNSAQYKLAGNSIVVSCLYFIFKNLFIKEEEKYAPGTQLSIF